MIYNKIKGKNIAVAAFAGIIGGFLNGFLGAGGGIILLWALKKLNPGKSPDSVRDNFASVVATVLILSTISAITYSHTGSVPVKELLPIAVPGVFGGILGAYLTDRLNTELLKTVFFVILIVAGINMVF